MNFFRLSLNVKRVKQGVRCTKTIATQCYFRIKF